MIMTMIKKLVNLLQGMDTRLQWRWRKNMADSQFTQRGDNGDNCDGDRDNDDGNCLDEFKYYK